MENYNPKALVQALAHEIRTPLGIINGYVELLNGGHNFPQAEREQIIYRMREATRRINDVLHHMEEGTFSLRLDAMIEDGDALHVRGTDAQEEERSRKQESKDA